MDSPNWRQPSAIQNGISLPKKPYWGKSPDTNKVGTRGLMSAFSEGKMFMVNLYYEEDRSKEAYPATNLMTPMINGRPKPEIYGKIRKVIVLARFVDGFIALPIYSHGGRGLVNKILSKNEYISLRNPGDTTPAESDHGVIFTTTQDFKVTEDSRFYITASSSIWIAAPVFLRYNIQTTPCGQLDRMSLQRLFELFKSVISDAGLRRDMVWSQGWLT